MRTLTTILLLTILFGCSDRQTKNQEVVSNVNQKNTKEFTISAIDWKLPLCLDEINLNDKNKTIQLNDGINSKIEEVIKDYAKDFEFLTALKHIKTLI